MRKLLAITTLFALLQFGLTGCGPVPVKTGKHPVPVEATTEPARTGMGRTRFRAAAQDTFAQTVLAEIENSRGDLATVPGERFMAEVFPGQGSATITELSSDRAIDRIRALSVTHIVLIEHAATGGEVHGKVSATATLLDTAQLPGAQTLGFVAEGHRAGISLPLPYIFLFFPYSDPDVIGSATTRIAAELSEKIVAPPGGPARITLLRSDNLSDVVAATRAPPGKEDGPPPPSDPMKKWKNPVGFYSDIMSDARDEGDAFYYNPLAHLHALLTSIILAPTVIVIDALIDEEGTRLQPQAPTARDPESEQLGYALDALNREDWDAAYRLLEDLVVSTDETLKLRTLQLLDDHPELTDAALNTFSTHSLEQSRETYGSSAAAIERRRLEMFRAIATPESYALAQGNYAQVFEQAPAPTAGQGE